MLPASESSEKKDELKDEAENNVREDYNTKLRRPRPVTRRVASPTRADEIEPHVGV